MVDRHVAKHIWTNSIKGLLKDSSILITTHQLNYIIEVDYIYHIENGAITEQGAPADILNKKSDIARRYHRFVSRVFYTLFLPAYARSNISYIFVYVFWLINPD